MRRIILFAFASFALAAAGCGGTSSANLSSDDVAVVGSKDVTKEQFRSLMGQAKRSYAAQKRAFPKPGSTEYEQLKGQAVTLLVQRAEFEQEAENLGVEITDEKVSKRLTQLKKQYYGGSEERYQKTLKQQGLTDEDARQQVRGQLLREALFDKITSDVKVTDAEIKAYYASHKSQYGQAESRDVRHILVNPNQKALADSIYNQLKAGANFAQLAKRYSKDPSSASTGGKLTISRGQTVREFDKTAFALKKGALSRPVKTQYGWHIIQALSDIKPATTTPLSKVKDSIRQQLEQKRKNDKVTEWVQETEKDYCDGRIKYQVGYQPNPDPCATLTSSTTTTTQ
jgi:parvulin-like peptidyl-prolyl isomerase